VTGLPRASRTTTSMTTAVVPVSNGLGSWRASARSVDVQKTAPISPALLTRFIPGSEALASLFQARQRLRSTFSRCHASVARFNSALERRVYTPDGKRGAAVLRPPSGGTY
jgi:hypothetical protein